MQSVQIFDVSERDLIVFGSKLGNARKVACYLAKEIDAPNPIAAGVIGDLANLIENSHASRLFLVASTWGDGELQDCMEGLFVRSTLITVPIDTYIIELGNYYGYDDFEFGALKIMEVCASQLGLGIKSRISVDSLPRIDWDTFGRWVKTEVGIQLSDD